METRVKGIYRNGRVELSEHPVNMPEESAVIVTFVKSALVDLRGFGISQEEAQELRARMAVFADEWDSPEMDDYDTYDAAIAERSAR